MIPIPRYGAEHQEVFVDGVSGTLILQSQRYNLPNYLKQTLELTKRNVESLFGRDKEKQEALGKWFG